MNKKFEKLEKSALGCMYVATGVVSIIAVAVLSLTVFFLELYKYIPVMIIYGVVIVLAILNALISPHFRYHRYRYMLDNDSMEIIEGYIFVSHQIVPIERIQNLQLQQGPIDRMFGVSKMTITTGGGDVTVRFVSKEVAEAMSDKLKTKINQLVVIGREENNDGEEC